MKIVELIEEARAAGAGLSPCCRALGLDPRTVQRWKAQDIGDDRRHGPKTTPRSKLTESERREVLAIANSPAYRNKSPKQLVPLLADQAIYIASESTIYRILREEDQLAHRGRAKPPESRPPREHRAMGPNKVYSWDITYLRAPIVGMFYHLYLYVDVWSRKIVGFRVAEVEDGVIASQLLCDVCAAEGVDPSQLVLHQDNGAPMKGATFKATMDKLGVTASFSRPRVSDDNAFSESLFKTLKYVPEYPKGPFASLAAAIAWVTKFVDWYNNHHLHSGIGFVAPADRHAGRSDEILAHRREVYEAAKRRHPERWSGATRNWNADDIVVLNPTKETKAEMNDHARAAA
jgi:transposase InsO family protein